MVRVELIEIDYGSGCVVRLGPKASAIYDGAQWAGGGYPSHQMFADELECLLEFAASGGVLSMYSKELRGRANQRDSALEELRVGKLLSDSGFPVVEWRPVGLAPKEGEFVVRGEDGIGIFVEVKSPGWEGEVSEAERAAGRLVEAKYSGHEAFYGNGGAKVEFAIEKAYPKFHPANHNLLVIADDLFVPLGIASSLWAGDALYWDKGKFSDNTYENLAGVGFLVKQQKNYRTWSEMKLFLNPHARVPLPPLIVGVFGGSKAA
jgi:hypothetical protein